MLFQGGECRETSLDRSPGGSSGDPLPMNDHASVDLEPVSDESVVEERDGMLLVADHASELEVRAGAALVTGNAATPAAALRRGVRSYDPGLRVDEACMPASEHSLGLQDVALRLAGGRRRKGSRSCFSNRGERQQRYEDKSADQRASHATSIDWRRRFLERVARRRAAPFRAPGLAQHSRSG